MNLRAAPNLPESLAGAFLVTDTCTLIDAIKTEDFRALLNDIKNAGCELFSIEAVKYEFLRGANTVTSYMDYIKFMQDLGVTFVNNFEKKLNTEEGRTFILLFNRYYTNKHKNKQPSYVDMLLLFMVYYYRKSAEKVLLITANHNDIPSFFTRNELIVFEERGVIRTEAIYQLDMSRLDRQIDVLLKS